MLDEQLNSSILSELNLREELLVLSAKKGNQVQRELHQEGQRETLERIYEEYKKQQLMETNKMLTDLAIGKFAELLESLGWIDSAAATGKKLQEKKLFRQDVNSLVARISPFIPYVGILEGGITVAEDVGKAQLRSSVAKAKISEQTEEKKEE